MAARGKELAPERAPLRRPAGPEQGGDGGEVRRAAGACLAAQLRRAADGARGGRSALRGEGSTLRRRRSAAHRMPEGHGGARHPVLEFDDRARGARRAPRAGRGARQFAARAGEAPRRHRRRRDRRAQHSHRHPAGLRARRGAAPVEALLPRRRRGSGAARRGRLRARQGEGLTRALLLALAAAAFAGQAAPSEEALSALRGRIESLRRELDGRQAAVERVLLARQALAAPEALRAVLSGDDPADFARRLYYVGYVSRAAAALIAGYRADLEALLGLQREAQVKRERLRSVEQASRADRDRILREREARRRGLERAAGWIRRTR